MKTGRRQVGGKVTGASLPYSLRTGLQWLINIKAFPTKSDAIRQALKDLLKKHGFYDEQKREALLLATQ